MTIRFQNTFRDILAFCFYHFIRSPIILVIYGVLFAQLSYVIFQSIPPDRSLGLRVAVFFIMEFVVIALLASVFSGMIVLSVISRRNKTFYAETTLTIAEEGITSESQYGKSELKWAIVQKLARNRRYIFLYFSQSAAHVIPRRVFMDKAEWDSFYEFCRQKTQK